MLITQRQSRISDRSSAIGLYRNNSYAVWTILNTSDSFVIPPWRALCLQKCITAFVKNKNVKLIKQCSSRNKQSDVLKIRFSHISRNVLYRLHYLGFRVDENVSYSKKIISKVMKNVI